MKEENTIGIVGIEMVAQVREDEEQVTNFNILIKMC